MRKSRRFLAAVLTAITLFTTPAFAANTDGLKNFQPVASWSDGLFTDLEPNSWYIKNVQTAYELGLMKGVGSGAFSPKGTISLGETIAPAARVHSIYKTGKADFTQGSPWYQVYVDYAAQNGIFTGNASTNYTASVTRRQFAAILAKALPEEALEPVNTVDDGMIPDVPEGAANYDDIYLLYRAGVLTGSDSKGTYHPETTIGRSSVAALVTRLVRPDLRQFITLADPGKNFSVTLNRTSLSLTEGETYKLTATVRPSDSGKTVSWSSSNTAVASVNSSGTITARSKGSATITAKVGDASAKCTVTVAAKEEGGITRIAIHAVSYTYMEVGATLSFRYDYYPEDAAPPKNVTWNSSDPSVATVDSNGTVTGISKGKTIITVSYGEMESPPVVITVFQSELTFTTPKMNYNYGPMTLVDRTHSGGVNQIVHLDRVEFTRVEDWDFGTVQELFLTVEGENFCYGKNGFTMRIKFYDANGTLLDTGHLTYVGGRDKPFTRRC